MNRRANGNSAPRIRIGLLGGTGLLMAMITMQACSKAAAGPNGGDVVSLKNGQAKAEVVANADTGEVMVLTMGLATHPGVFPVELLPVLVCPGHPAVLDPAAAHPIRLSIETATETARVSVCRVWLKLDRLFAAANDQ